MAIKFKVDSESTSKISRHIREASRKAYDYSSEFAKEKSQWGMDEAKRMWSDKKHPVYKYTQPYYQGTMEDFKDDAMEYGRKYYGNSKDYANSMYSDDSVFGTSLEEVVRQINQQRKQLMRYIMELLRDTPVGKNK